KNTIFFDNILLVIMMSKISKELIGFKKMLEEDEFETYKNNEIEDLNVDFLIDYIYDNEFFLDDTRHQGYTLHSLEEILLIVIFGLLSNCNTYKDIELFIKIHYNWLVKNLKLYNGIPSISTIRRVISIIKPKELETLCNEVFFKYIENKENIYNENDFIIADIYSLDGKVANGSEINTVNGKINKTNAMSAYSIKYNKTLATEFIDSKTNEIPTCPKLLARLNIKDSIITFDALNTQEKTIKYIYENKAHYVVPVKDNHKDFAEELSSYFHDSKLLKECNKYITNEKAHNKFERREYYFTNNINWITKKEKWMGLKSIGYIKKYINDKLSEERYFISDIDCKYVEQLSKVIRSEWQIENNLHWYLDTVFKEDANKSYIENSQKNLNIIRKFCLGIIKQIKDEYKLSVNSVRQILSMDFENEIERIFESLH
ncbi:MAG: ISAs1 family transposase, partial [Bacilli bacterium]